jgi:2-hydroxychromene-2-carboxylate isomerase
MKSIDFYYSIGSRYSYLAQSQIAALERDFSVAVRWSPLRSAELMRAAGRTPFEGTAASTQYVPAYRSLDAERWARLYGIAYREPDWAKIDFARVNLAAVAASGQADPRAYSEALFRQAYGEGAAVFDDRTLAALARAAGLDGDRLIVEIDAPETQARHHATLEAALSVGVFGVPSFVIGGEVFWGNDRIVLLRHHLAG